MSNIVLKLFTSSIQTNLFKSKGTSDTCLLSIHRNVINQHDNARYQVIKTKWQRSRGTSFDVNKRV